MSTPREKQELRIYIFRKVLREVTNWGISIAIIFALWKSKSEAPLEAIYWMLWAIFFLLLQSVKSNLKL
jgi:hypothetical protein